MTTIATDGKSIAGDSMAVSGDLTAGADVVKVWKHAGALYGVCGRITDLTKFKNWLNKGDMEEAADLSDDFSAIMVTQDGVFFFDNQLEPHKGKNLWAIGSGRELALGAMYAGASPTEALRIAAKLNINTGGKIRTLHLDD